jgi:hypothetical protein
MVRELTMFELHFDGVSVGSRGSGPEESDGEPEAAAGETEDGGSKLRPVVAVVGLLLVVAALRRFAKRRSAADYDIPIAEDSAKATAEQ